MAVKSSLKKPVNTFTMHLVQGRQLRDYWLDNNNNNDNRYEEEGEKEELEKNN